MVDRKFVDFRLSQTPEKFREYGELYGLEPDQIYWGYAKNRELAQSISADPDDICWKFRQEYPATADKRTTWL